MNQRPVFWILIYKIKTMRKTELIVSLILKDFFYYVAIFLILYYIYKMDQKGRKAIRDKNKID
jgi:hypothetical protein